jgi:hypothetical protein
MWKIDPAFDNSLRIQMLVRFLERLADKNQAHDQGTETKMNQ